MENTILCETNVFAHEAYELGRDTNRIACEMFRFMQSLYYNVGKSNKTYKTISGLLNDELCSLRSSMDDVVCAHFNQTVFYIKNDLHVVGVEEIFYHNYGFGGNFVHPTGKKKSPLEPNINTTERRTLDEFVVRFEELIPRMKALRDKCRQHQPDLDAVINKFLKKLNKLKL